MPNPETPSTVCRCVPALRPPQPIARCHRPVTRCERGATRIAPAETRAEVSAEFYVPIYLGVALPAIGIGVLAVTTTLFIAVATFAAVTGGASLLVAGWHLSRN